ncbi:MAG: DUF3344 domain-containing protein [bacterium]|nr:DUF3344 domain-containing protein [bacterium]
MKCSVETRSWRSFFLRFLAVVFGPAILAVLVAAGTAHAGTPISLYRSFAGQVDFTGTGGSLRAASNGVDACAVVGSSSGDLTGVPGGARIEAAYLYWAGSYSTYGGSTSAVPDYDILFDGQPLSADRAFTEVFPYGWYQYDFFSGVCDVTAQVDAKGNGTYTFGGLTVNTGFPHCNVQTVLAGWSLVVVYRHPAETNRVVNVYDGFQFYQGGEISVTADNFRISDTDIDGKACHITWEGDETNSQSRNGYTEGLSFNGAALTDALNPANNQFNSTINVLGTNTSYGVDFDIYDVTPWLSPGDGSATSRYTSGQDLVLLSAEVISVTNAPTADLAVTLTHPADMPLYDSGDLVVTVTNLGPANENDVVTVTVPLPPGLEYVSASGNGWTIDASGAPTIIATIGRALPAGQSMPSLTVTVRPDGTVTGGVVLAASVSSPTFDYQPGNDATSSVVNLVEPTVALSAVKSHITVEDPFNGTFNPKAIPGAFVEYGVEVSNRFTRRIDRNTVVFVDAVPAGTTLHVDDLPGNSGPVRFTQGAVTSRLRYRFRGLADLTDDVHFSADGGLSWNYAPVADAFGCDAAVTHVRVTPRGRMGARTAAGAASFLLEFRVRMD